MSTVAATKEIKTSTKYSYDYTHLPPLAMVGAVTEEEAFSSMPDFIQLAAHPTLKILINSIMIGITNKGDDVEFVQQVLKKIQAVAQKLSGEDGRDLSKVVEELDRQNSPAGYSPLSMTQEGFSENDFLKFLPPLGYCEGAVGHFVSIELGVLHETWRLRRRLLHRPSYSKAPGQVPARVDQDRRGDQRAE